MEDFQNLERRLDKGRKFRSRRTFGCGGVVTFFFDFRVSTSLVLGVSRSHSKLLPLPVRKLASTISKMKETCSLPNLNRDTTSFPNFFTFIQEDQHPADPDDNNTTLNKRPKTNDPEPSVTSPFEGIPSTTLSSGEKNENHHQNFRVFTEWDQMDRPPSPNGSDTNVSVGSNRFEDILCPFNSFNPEASEASTRKDILSQLNSSEASEAMNEIEHLPGTNSVAVSRPQSVQTLPNTSYGRSKRSSGGDSFAFPRTQSFAFPRTQSVESRLDVNGSKRFIDDDDDDGISYFFSPRSRLNPTRLRWGDQSSPLNFPESEFRGSLFNHIGKADCFSSWLRPNPTQLWWWDQSSPSNFPESEFRRAFKMSKLTFEFICRELDPVINKDIPVRQRVAVCIWQLATGDPLSLVSNRFGLGISTCRKAVLEVCGAIRSVLMSKFLKWPDEGKMTEVKREFELVSGIPNVGGSMYTTHVPITKPKVYGHAYFNKRLSERNRKTLYSITVQGVVDSKGVFTDICIGWPGSMSDDKILEKSSLSQHASRGLLKDVWIVGNGGYPLMDWVLVPYPQQASRTQRVFNEKVGEVGRVAKEAFSRLKGRWSCFQKMIEVKPLHLPVVLGAACVLHNICEMRNEAMDPSETSFDLFDDEIVPEDAVRSVDAMRARDQIAYLLLHH